MSFVLYIYHVANYQLRRLRTYPLGLVLGAGVVLLLFFFVIVWILTGLLTSAALSVRSVQHRHRLAVIVPFRDRFDELVQFVPHMTTVLTAQRINHRIFIINQVDKLRFNRASLINAGYTLVKDNYDYMAMHDIDLLPVNPEIVYSFPLAGPMHLAAPDLHPRYHYEKFIGGIILLTNKDFEKVDGMSNKYWGWGMEDDELYVRLKEAQLNVSRPQGIKTGFKTFKHIHSPVRRRRDMEKLPGQRESNRRRDRQTGLRNVDYKLLGEHALSLDHGPEFTVFDVELHCDKEKTPWCVLPDSASDTAQLP